MSRRRGFIRRLRAAATSLFKLGRQPGNPGNPGPPKRFVLICGTGHCGTGWLAKVAHRPERGVAFFHQIKVDLLRGSWKNILRHELEQGVDGARFEPYFEFIDRQAVDVVGDSMSWSFHSIPLVHRVRPVDFVAVLVRNGIQTVHSMYQHNRDLPTNDWLFSGYFRRYWEMLGQPGGSWEEYDPWRCWCFNWSLSLRMLPLLRDALGETRCSLWRLEDLTSNVAKLREACAALAPGIAFSDEELARLQDRDVNRKIEGDRSPTVLWQGWTERQRRDFIDLCGDSMKELGYGIPQA